MPIILSRRNIARRNIRTVRKQSRLHSPQIPQVWTDCRCDRYSKYFTVIEPTAFNVCDYWFSKDQNRLRDIRPDALSQMLNLANIRPGGKYLAVDDASGVIVAGILERLGGDHYRVMTRASPQTDQSCAFRTRSTSYYL